jgi:hypothetical protein
VNTEIVKAEIVNLPADASNDVLAELLNRVAVLKEAAKEAADMLDARMVEMIQESGQDIVIGTVRYYVGVKKTWKCADKKRAIEAVMQLADTEDQVASLLSSDPVKRGAVAALAEEKKLDIGGIWTCDESDELREGNPKLQKIDTKFLR